MTSIYRLLRKPFAANPFDGEGSFRYGGRWSRPGTRVVYTAEHLSLAMLEYLVHMDADRAPSDLVMARADVPDSVSRIRVKVGDLPGDWRGYPAPEALQDLGDMFARDARAAILIVPSALAVTESNWILNPAHPHLKKVRFHPAAQFDYDPRQTRRRH